MERWRKFVPAALPWALFALLLGLTFERWGDVVIDCFRDPAAAWLLSGGKALYRDVAYPYLPLAPHLLALLFKIFGVHLRVEYALGGGAAALSLALLISLSRRFAWRGAAVWTGVLFLSACVFPPFIFNYLFPYSLAALLGVPLVLGALWVWLKYLDDRRPAWLLVGAALLALALANRLETALLALLAALSAFAILLAEARLGGRPARPIRLLVLFLLPAVFLAALLYLPTYTTVSWSGFWERNASPFRFDRAAFSMFLDLERGTFGDWVPTYLLSLLLTPGVFLVLAAAAYLFSKRRAGRLAVGLAVALFPLLTLAGLARPEAPPGRWAWGLADLWLRLGARFPHGVLFPSFEILAPLALGLGAASLYRLWGMRRAWDPAAAGPRFAALLICTVAAAASYRVLAALQPEGYAVFFLPFYLPVLALGLGRAAGLLAGRFPRLDAGRLRFALAAGLAVVALWPLNNDLLTCRIKSYRLERPRGGLYTDRRRGAVLDGALRAIERNTRPDDRILAAPEEAILYFLSGRPPAVHRLQLLRVILDRADEERILRDLAARPPALAIISNRSQHQYGAGYLGLDYFKELARRLEAEYRPLEDIGDFVFDNRRHGFPSHRSAGYGLRVYGLKQPPGPLNSPYNYPK